MLILGGLDKIFELGPFWREEKAITPRHLSESLGLDIEIYDVKSSIDIINIIGELLNELTQKLISERLLDKKELISKNIKILKYDKAFKLLTNAGISHDYNKDIGYKKEHLLSEIVKKIYGTDIFAVYMYPNTIKKFYTKRLDKKYTDTFDLFYKGWELSSGAIRELDIKKIKNAMRECNINPDKYNFYFDSFSTQRPHGGFCIGIDRLITKLLNLEKLEDTVFFPRSKTHIIP